MISGRVVISLDFELGWGHRQTRPEYVKQLKERKSQIRPRINTLIDIFDAKSIEATWATVGAMLEKGDDPVFHAVDLFENLRSSTVDHEIGLHSYAHRNFCTLSPTEAKEDIEQGLAVLERWDISPNSFVFPEDDLKHLGALLPHDFTAYRVSGTTSRLHRLGDIIWPPVHRIDSDASFPVPVSTSIFLASKAPARVRRFQVRRGIDFATESGGYIHLWLHPHNVVMDPSLLDLLDELFGRIATYRDRGELEVVTMAELVSSVRKSNIPNPDN